MPSFFNGKRFFLTYAQCPEDKEGLLTFLRTRGTLQSFVVAREQHADGQFHLHACVAYEQVIRAGKRHFDFEGKHPNVQSPRNWNACIQYCKKDGDFIESDVHVAPATTRDVSEFDDEVEYFKYACEAKIPFAYAQYFWSKKTQSDTLYDDEAVGTMERCLQEFVYDFAKPLILIGPSGCGKTTWAKKRVPKPSLFVSHIDQLKAFIPEFHKSIIFDDMDFKHYPRTGQIHLVDTENPRAIHCRYSTATIPAGVAKVFTCNEVPVNTQDPAIRRRVVIRHVPG